jgi:hypothetical protein
VRVEILIDEDLLPSKWRWWLWLRFYSCCFAFSQSFSLSFLRSFFFSVPFLDGGGSLLCGASREIGVFVVTEIPFSFTLLAIITLLASYIYL